ncbi:hypothetical protein FDH34_gp150 [Serratia phage BF]|uniref:Uncharacterized protein n=1 Tax=Serratia phage BF TaxID=1962671 RepID=A0A1S6UAA6_9CAUD|nr:hypothetical protein FDH34_gp150 [Serratia phage BF]AQW88675.1 hypothetical protein BF_0150 [Serratia phage BF]
MNDIMLMILMFRQNSKLLKEYTNSDSATVRKEYRKKLIQIKSYLSTISSEQYNIIKAISTDFDRFNVFHMKTDYNPQMSMVRLRFSFIHPSTGEIYRIIDRANSNGYYHPLVLHDTKMDVFFILDRDTTIVDNVEVFEKGEHNLLVKFVSELQKAKEREAHILHQKKVREEELAKERKKASILAKYS